MESNNMHYRFNVEYFSRLPDNYYPSQELFSDIKFECAKDYLKKLDEVANVTFSLCTAYPGPMMGVGYPHAGSGDDFISNGFSFDYVTGLPYLPGSSLKGILRSYFDAGTKEVLEEKRAFIAQLCGQKFDNVSNRDAWISSMINKLFEGDNVYLGAYPMSDTDILGFDVITPHRRLKAPNPNKITKINPNIEIKFFFILQGGDEERKKIADLFKKLLLLGGIGAKTNVGFGQLREEFYEVPKAKEENQTYDASKKIENTRSKAKYTINAVYTASVNQHNRTGKFAYAKLDEFGEKVSFYDNGQCKEGEVVKLKYLGTKESNGRVFTNWQRVK